MKNLIILFSLLFVCFSSLNAQEYKTAIGARLGYSLSVSIKQFISESHAIEAYLGTRGRYDYRWASISAAYLLHKPIEAVELEGLNWYYGFGGSAYFWTWDDRYSYYKDQYSSTSFGVQGYLGVDYKFQNIPLNITLDWVPSFFLNGFGSGFGGGYGSVAVRYTLK